MKYLVGRCPKCNSDELYSSDVVNATAGIMYWVRDNSGVVSPEYEGESKVEWSSQRPKNANKPYQCPDCMKGPFSISEIKFDEEK